MNATTVAVDLAKNVFELAVADQHWKIVARHRLTRGQFERWFAHRSVDRVVMESCGSAHHWARWLTGRGIEVRLLPPRYVRPYVKRNKTDAADAAALLEALRCADIAPVRIKSVEQQALQSLHRIRSLWMATRTARINALRGFCREFGIAIAGGSGRGVAQIAAVVADPDSAIPSLLRASLSPLLEEIRLLEARIVQLEAQLTATARQSPACATLLSVPGVGLLTATALVAATGGTVAHFKSARHFAAWLGLTPREASSGTTRHLGGISKRGDRYLRMLLIHGARSVLWAARTAQRTARPLDGLRQWVLALQARRHHNTAACALANKLARICYAVLRDQEPFSQARLTRKIRRQTYAVPA
jgi:transposase